MFEHIPLDRECKISSKNLTFYVFDLSTNALTTPKIMNLGKEKKGTSPCRMFANRLNVTYDYKFRERLICFRIGQYYDLIACSDETTNYKFRNPDPYENDGLIEEIEKIVSAKYVLWIQDKQFKFHLATPETPETCLPYNEYHAYSIGRSKCPICVSDSLNKFLLTQLNRLSFNMKVTLFGTEIIQQDVDLCQDSRTVKYQAQETKHGIFQQEAPHLPILIFERQIKDEEQTYPAHVIFSPPCKNKKNNGSN